MEREQNNQSEKEKMLNGLYFNFYDPILQKENSIAHKKCMEYNNTKPNEEEKRKIILKSLIKIEENSYFLISKNLFCEFGYNIIIKNNFFSLFNITFIDYNKISFGNNIFINPNCTFYTLNYPLDYNERNKDLVYSKPISIGNNIYFGSNVCILPGINIGNNIIILDGCIVSKNIPDNSLVYGNPCQIEFIGENFNNEKNILELINLIKNENLNLCYEYNLNYNEEERNKFIKEKFKSTSNDEFYLMERLNFLNGKKISIGEDFYSNYNCTLIDTSEIEINNSTMFGPNVTLNTITIKKENEEYKIKHLPIKIGNNVWIGGNVNIIGGIKIGNNSVIGAGCFVNKDISENCVVIGNPCKILRIFDIKKIDYLNLNDERTQKEKMLNEEIHFSDDKELCNDREKSFLICHKFNYCENDDRIKFFDNFFKNENNKNNKGINIIPFFNCDYGYNINFKGDKFFSNCNLILLDICEISFGNNCLIGPNCSFYCPYHPIEDIEGRENDIEYGKKIIIGNNVCIKGNCVILAGVKIGDNCVIGYGSIVTRNIPDNYFAYGNPCRIKNKIID